MRSLSEVISNRVERTLQVFSVLRREFALSNVVIFEHTLTDYPFWHTSRRCQPVSSRQLIRRRRVA
jgi:hypothetical protein